MPQIRFTNAALRDLERLREFLCSKNPMAAKRAGEIIINAIQGLAKQPQLGPLVEDMPPRIPGMADQLRRKRVSRTVPLRGRLRHNIGRAPPERSRLLTFGRSVAVFLVTDARKVTTGMPI